MAEWIEKYAPIVISVGALIILLMSYLTVRRNERRLLEGKNPIITANITPVENQPRWFLISFSVENRADVRFRCDFVTIKRPWFVRGIDGPQSRQYKIKEELWQSAPLKRTLPISSARRRIPMNFTLAKGGVLSSGPFPGATHWDVIYVYAPPWWWSRSLSMLVSLTSIEAKERTKLFTVRRKIPAVANSKSD